MGQGTGKTVRRALEHPQISMMIQIKSFILSTGTLYVCTHRGQYYTEHRVLSYSSALVFSTRICLPSI